MRVGETLTASMSGIADTDGLTGVAYSYQWMQNDGSSDTDIQDETDADIHRHAGRCRKSHQGTLRPSPMTPVTRSHS